MSFEGTDITVEDHEPSEQILVIAPSRRRFVWWCREHDINPNSSKMAYVSSVADLIIWHDVLSANPEGVWYADLGGVDPEYNRLKEFYEILSRATRTGGFREMPR